MVAVGLLVGVAGLAILGVVKTREALRSRRCKKKGCMNAKLPQNEVPYSESEATVRDGTGAIVRALEVGGGLELYVREFDIEGGVVQKGTVVLVHGLTWHSAYFQQFATVLNKQGFVVYTYDLRGHGLSGQVDGIPGYAKCWSDHVDDALAVLDFTESRHPGVPCFIFGESMGGAIVMSLLTERASEPTVKGLRGAMFGAPLLQIQRSTLPPPPIIFVMKLLSLVLPKLPLPSLKDFDASFGDTEIAKQAREDPLVLFNGPRLQFSIGVISEAHTLKRKAISLQLPWLIIHGALDVKTELSVSQEVYLKSTCKDKTLKLYPDAHHQLLQDKQDITYRAINDFVTWLLDHTEST